MKTSRIVTSQSESSERLQILAHAAKLKKQGFDKLAIRFDVNPVIFAILRNLAERSNITPSQAAYHIVVDWVDRVNTAMEADEADAIADAAESEKNKSSN